MKDSSSKATRRSPWLAVLVLAALTPLRAAAQQVASESGAESLERCVAVHEESQKLLQQSRLLEARQSLRQCSTPSCPSLLRSDCSHWVDDVERRLPSVIFYATDNGEDAVALRVFEGERLLSESVTGRPLELDPGPHTFRAELRERKPIVTTYVLREGDKQRVIRFDFRSATPSGVEAAAEKSRPIPTTTYVFGAVALAAAAGGATLGVMALSERKSAEGKCSPLCTDDEVGSVKTLALYSDLSFGAAAVSAGLATYFFLSRDEVERPAARASALVDPNLLGLAIEGAF
jgi:hypothetical protein